MKKHLLLFGFIAVFLSGIFLFLFSNFSVLATKNGSLPIPDDFKIEGKNIVNSPIDSYYAAQQDTKDSLASIGKSDSRPVIVNNFLSKHNSPMQGLGNVFVSVADKYGIDYRLLPAIAFQESTLGKKIPKNSHNAWGWAIYTGTSSGAKFHDWQYAIETVAKGLKTDYIDRGLATPEAIMTRYTDSDGSWAFGVNFAINEMTPK